LVESGGLSMVLRQAEAGGQIGISYLPPKDFFASAFALADRSTVEPAREQLHPEETTQPRLIWRQQ
jgi:hypothetical protein